MRLMMCFQAPTMIYVFMYHIVPHFFADYHPWVQYYLKVLCWFILINGMANYLCVILYDPSYRKTKDNPYISLSQKWDKPPDRFISQSDYLNANGGTTNGHCVYDMGTKDGGLQWSFCDQCDMHVPPRTHHCKFCDKCILKRDHHCFMVGNCIGFKNQRFFIVLAFYAMITGGLGAFFTISYVQEIVWPELDSWIDLIPYVAIWKGLFGTMKVLHAILIIHSILEPVFGLVGFVYFISQMTIVMEGKTLFEVSKKVPIKNLNSYNRNLKSVFGAFWGLNFLFPMVLIFRQTDDGIHWENVKIDRRSTNHKKWKNDAEIL